MKSFKPGRLAFVAPLLALATGSSGCDEAKASNATPVAVQEQAQLGDLAEQCGLDINCELGGIADGRANISGVASVDAFFASVVKFEGVAASVSGGIEAELEAIRADFGLEAGAQLGAGIMAQADLYASGGINIKAEPAQCRVDAQATLEAQARCDAEFDPGSAMVRCQGSCEVEASAEVDCGAEATLSCTLKAPSIACEGSCKGSCTAELDAAAECSGTCNGTCDGECSFVNGDGECAGECDGMCTGSCTAELKAAASCEGTCEGECTVENPEAGCEGGIRAKCEAMGEAMVDCQGSCDGEIEPPMAKAECQASAKADASLNVECTPPSIQIDYELAVGGSVDVEAQARFVAAVENLKVRLPKLMASLKKADLVVKAGGDLSASATGAVKGAVEVAAEGDIDIKTGIGLKCALGELDAVGSIITNATSRLEGSVSASAELTGALMGG